MCSEFIPGDICDKHAVATAMANIDVLIHLAAFPDITDAEGKMVDFIDTLLMPNVAGLYICVEAALQAVTPHDSTSPPSFQREAEVSCGQGVSRVVLASSVQVITGLTSSADVEARPKPNLPAVGGTELFFGEKEGVAPLHEYTLTKVIAAPRRSRLRSLSWMQAAALRKSRAEEASGNQMRPTQPHD